MGEYKPNEPYDPYYGGQGVMGEAAFYPQEMIHNFAAPTQYTLPDSGAAYANVSIYQNQLEVGAYQNNYA